MSNQVKILKSTKLNFGLAELRSDDILTFLPNKNLRAYSLNQLEEMLNTFNTITEGEAYLYYSDNTCLNPNFSSEAKAFMGEHFHKFAKAFAMTENSAITRFVTHTFIYLNKPKIPIKMFRNKEDAINWLKSLNLN